MRYTSNYLDAPALAYADHDSWKNNEFDNDEHRWGDHDKDRDGDVPVVPEANAGCVLVPFLGECCFIPGDSFLVPRRHKSKVEPVRAARDCTLFQCMDPTSHRMTQKSRI